MSYESGLLHTVRASLKRGVSRFLVHLKEYVASWIDMERRKNSRAPPHTPAPHTQSPSVWLGSALLYFDFSPNPLYH